MYRSRLVDTSGMGIHSITVDANGGLFAPRVDLSQTDIHSLDGQNLSGRDALRSVLE